MVQNKYEKLNIDDFRDEWELANEIHSRAKSWKSVAVYGGFELITTLSFIMLLEYDYDMGYSPYVSEDTDKNTDGVYCLIVDKWGEIYVYENCSHRLFPFIRAAYISQDDCKQPLIDAMLSTNCDTTLFGIGDVDEPSKPKVRYTYRKLRFI